MENMMKAMKIKLKTIRDNYVINQVEKAEIPTFEQDKICRYRVTFSGRVQKVGFRLEVCELAKRLELTGYCRNLENGDVETEIQGPKNKIKYLVSFMESLVRIKVTKRKVEKMEVTHDEREFEKLKSGSINKDE